MPRTKPATHPLAGTTDPYAYGQRLIDGITNARKSVVDDFIRSLNALGSLPRDPHRGQLCIVATEAGLHVRRRAEMPSDEALSRKADDYCFWFGLPSGVDKRVLERLQPPALTLLLLLQSWVCAVNRMVREGSSPHSTDVVSLTDDICAAAAAFVICLTPQTDALIKSAGRPGIAGNA